jgi:hypothetical protein
MLISTLVEISLKIHETEDFSQISLLLRFIKISAYILAETRSTVFEDSAEEKYFKYLGMCSIAVR